MARGPTAGGWGLMVGAKPQPSLWVVGASAARIGAHRWSGADFQQHRHHCCAHRLPEAEGDIGGGTKRERLGD